MRYHHLSIAVPMMDELDNIPFLLEDIRQQSLHDFSLYVCVNQPDEWCSDSSFATVYHANQQSLALLRTVADIPITLIDCSSPGCGWTAKRKGVGWARKRLFECILDNSNADEIIVSMDADTHFNSDYFESILDCFNANPAVSALSIPYYHNLTGNESMDRPLLRYECYMRHYLIQMLSIHNPYAFTAIGSAMAFPAWAYKRVGGITPLQGGEDFYLMQKFVKTGTISSRLKHLEQDAYKSVGVFPSGRVSSRVPFGTGPAVALSISEQQQRYPFFHHDAFIPIQKTFDSFHDLYDRDFETPMSLFLREQLAVDDLWGPLRKNFKKRDLFIRACQERVDGLRILQFLKQLNLPQEPNLPDFQTDSITVLDNFRNKLFRTEMSLRR